MRAGPGSPALIVHGHFYQPPRENPWIEVTEREPSAQPYHDWNERITVECYRPNAFARVFDGAGRIEDIVNNYDLMSFNFGPTLMAWLERADPVTYRRVLDGDRASAAARGGHGNAIAQAYNHAILPLSTPRDRKTQIIWGVADFRRRFGREPESLWLPETACNDDSLGALIDQGLRYVILSPHQAERVRPLATEDAEWRDVSDGSVDPTQPYRYFHRDGSGRSIVIFFYDGYISKAVAFEGALASSRDLVDRFANTGTKGGRAVHIATDGETYGHHHRHGERCLAYALAVEAPSRGFWVTNYGELLDHVTVTMEAEIKPGPDGEGTAWSCSHGVGRWTRSCGCQTGGPPEWNQHWRGPLRSALDLLRDRAAQVFDTIGGDLFADPWAARDAYIELVLDRDQPPDEFLARHARRPLHGREPVQALTLLELQRSCLLMYTSCGWFFTDISGIETVQVLKYAARALDFVEELASDSPRRAFVERLGEARSNVPALGTGADVFRRLVEPTRVSPERMAAHLAITGLVADERGADGAPSEPPDALSYRHRIESARRESNGRFTVSTARVEIESVATGDRNEYGFAALHFGGVDFYCVLKPFPGVARFAQAAESVWTTFPGASLAAMLRVAQRELGPDEYGLEHVLPDGRRRISGMVFADIVQRLSEVYARAYEENRPSIEMLSSAGFELPEELKKATEFTLSRRFAEEIQAQRRSRDPSAYRKAIEIAEEVAKSGFQIDRRAANLVFGEMITDAVALAAGVATDEAIGAAIALCRLRDTLRLRPRLDEAQENLFEALRANPALWPRFVDLAPLLHLSPRVFEQALNHEVASAVGATLGSVKQAAGALPSGGP